MAENLSPAREILLRGSRGKAAVPSVRAAALFYLVAKGGENDLPGDKTGPAGSSPITGRVPGAEAIIPPAAGPCVKEEVVIL